MKLNYLLIGGFLIVAFFVSVVGYFGFSGTQGVFEAFDHIVDDTAKEVIALENIKSASLRMQSEALGFALIKAEILEKAEEEEEEEEEEEFYKAKEEIEKWEAEFEKFAEEDEKELVKRIDVAEELIENLAEELINLKKQGLSGQVILDKKEELEEAEEEFLEIIDGAIEEELEEFEEQDEAADKLASRTINLILIVSGIAFLLAIGLGLFISRSISKPLAKLKSDLDEITKGKLDIQLQGSKIDEVNALTNSLSRILASMKLAILRTGMKKEDIGIREESIEKTMGAASVKPKTKAIVKKPETKVTVKQVKK